MAQQAARDTRDRLIEAAAELVATTPGEDISLREVCSMVGVKMPTLYHFFGSKQGLIEAVTERGFDMYLGQKSAMESSGDPIQDLRHGWDVHVDFGLANPGFYTLMYGTVRPGFIPAAQNKASAILRDLTAQAAAQHRLVVSSEQAAAHILATNVGVTLRQIVCAKPDPELSRAVRDGVLATVTGTHRHDDGGDSIASVLEFAGAHPEVLGEEETRLLSVWLRRLKAKS
ncbi:TetR/AcrR family transcriptional regulator [Kocuria massiliensis]|uniref:TetR/AcrR family transcriptional regulator n=1 Tax=Kocuria massiliensis TaxID=1926282 RepID=UPI000A1CB3CD|nr:TetR/AcrR family transcriptional regulator [Kocuria massiliensis]